VVVDRDSGPKSSIAGVTAMADTRTHGGILYINTYTHMWSQPPTPHVCDREGWLGGWLERERTRASFVFKGSKMYCSSKAIECGRRFRSLALLCRCRCPCWHRCRTSAGAEQWSWTNMLRRMCGWVVCVCMSCPPVCVRTNTHM